MNLKPFSIEAAKSGAPVITRDGRKVRIVCWDARHSNYPIVGLIDCAGEETSHAWTVDGRSIFGLENLEDLFHPPDPPRSVWVNFYIDSLGHEGLAYWSSEEAAKAHAREGATRTAVEFREVV